MTYPVARGQFINAAIFETDYSKEGQLYTDPWVSANIDSKSLISVFENWESSTRELVEVRSYFDIYIEILWYLYCCHSLTLFTIT